MNKRSVRAAAVIEIGANSVQLHVGQLQKEAVAILDVLDYPVSLGYDVFEQGSISFAGLRELSEVLSKFSQALLSYNILKPKVVSCTVMREAKNRALVIDQLRVRNGITVTVLEDGEEKAYLYGDMMDRLSRSPTVKFTGNTLLAYIGSGSIGLSVHDGSKIIYQQNIPMGALKMHEKLWTHQRTETDFHCMAEEYLASLLGRVELERFAIENVIFSGTEVETIATLSGGKPEGSVIRLKQSGIQELYSALCTLPTGKIALTYGVSEEQAAVMYAALSFYHGILQRTSPRVQSVAVTTNISEAMMNRMLMPKTQADFTDFLQKGALGCAEATAKKFGCYTSHAEMVRELSCRIFDKMKKIHGLEPSKRFILELAALLHGCGNFVSAHRHSKCTYHIVKALDIFGVTQQELMETAFVAGSVTGVLMQEENGDIHLLSSEEQIVISKLVAIFQIANALDKAHSSKLQDVKLSFEEDRILFRASSSHNTLLERWAFRDAARLFEKAFGLSPELIVRCDTL